MARMSPPDPPIVHGPAAAVLGGWRDRATAAPLLRFCKARVRRPPHGGAYDRVASLIRSRRALFREGPARASKPGACHAAGGNDRPGRALRDRASFVRSLVVAFWPPSGGGTQALKSTTSRTRLLYFQTPIPTQWKAGFFMFRQWPPFDDFSDWKNRCDARTAVLAYDAVRQPMFSPQLR